VALEHLVKHLPVVLFLRIHQSIHQLALSRAQELGVLSTVEVVLLFRPHQVVKGQEAQTHLDHDGLCRRLEDVLLQIILDHLLIDRDDDFPLRFGRTALQVSCL